MNSLPVVLPERCVGDLRIVVMPLLFGRARLLIGQVDATGYDRAY